MIGCLQKINQGDDGNAKTRELVGFTVDVNEYFGLAFNVPSAPAVHLVISSACGNQAKREQNLKNRLLNYDSMIMSNWLVMLSDNIILWINQNQYRNKQTALLFEGMTFQGVLVETNLCMIILRIGETSGLTL